jgi:hypothetical protein
MKQNPNIPIDNSSSSSLTSSKSPILPLTLSEQQLTWKRLKTHHKDNNGMIQLTSSNNLPVSFLPIPNARTGSADASQRTVRARSQILRQINLTSSSPFTATPAQQQHHTTTQIKSIYRQLHVNITHKLSTQDMLAFDKLTYLPYNLLRTIRSFLHHHNVNVFPSEYVMRKQASQLAHQYELGTFNMGDNVVPFCRIINISSLLNIIIASLFNNRQLMYYPNMPTNQIQIQTQADKGANSTKLCIQIINQSNINSVKHVLPVACYEGTNSSISTVTSILMFS